jgi:hypothetical protein
MNRRSRLICWILLAGALFLSMGAAPGQGSSTSLALRLFGPVSSLAAGWQWVRVRSALDHGRSDLAYSRANLALELDPGSTGAWSFLAAHMANDRGSPFRQPEPILRTRWTQAAIDLLERGEDRARRPAELASQCGTILVRVAEYGGEIPWPGGSAGALEDAEPHFERATRLDPTSSEAWTLLAALRGLWLASAEVTASPQERVAALRAGLATLDQASEHVTDLGGTQFQRGILLGLFADDGSPADFELWPGGQKSLYGAAIEAFEAAESKGFPAARDARLGAQQALRSLQ